MTFLPVSVLLLSAAGWAGEAAMAKDTPDPFSSVRYAAPAGWSVAKSSARKGPELRFAKGADVIRLRRLGGPGSRYKGPADYLAGFEATTMGKPPEKVRQTKVAGKKVWVYRHGYPIVLGDPHVQDPSPPRLAREEFCVIPYRGQFFVLSWAWESPVPDLESAGEDAWRAFLSSFTINP